MKLYPVVSDKNSFFFYGSTRSPTHCFNFTTAPPAVPAMASGILRYFHVHYRSMTTGGAVATLTAEADKIGETAGYDFLLFTPTN